jgi:formate/nitrite transporter FocA (FNT family)
MTVKPVEIVSVAEDVGRHKSDLGVPNFLVRGFIGGTFIAMGATLVTSAQPGWRLGWGPVSRP